MKFTKEIPTKPGFYLWRTKLTRTWVVAEVLTIGPSAVLWLDTDGTREPLSEMVESQKHNDLYWCRLVPSEEIEKAWDEAWWKVMNTVMQNLPIPHPMNEWGASRAKRVMEGEE